MEGWRVILKTWRGKMAAAIYFLIGAICLTACVSIAITGAGGANSDAGIDREVDIEIEGDKNETD